VSRASRQQPTEAALAALSPSVHGLVRALFQHAPQPDWTPVRHREVFEAATAGREPDPTVRVTPSRLGVLETEWHVPLEVRSELLITHLHGGGFIMGSLATTRPLASALAAATGRRVVVLDYPLAPETTHPGQPDAIFDALLDLCGDLPGGGRLVLAGDSAGGALALGAERALHRRGLGDRVAGLVLLSPLLDLRLTAPSLDSNAETDPQLPRWLVEQMVTAYRGNADPGDPAVSAVLGSLEGLAPTLVQAAPHEALADDARLLARRADEYGATVELQWWNGMIHVWHQFAPRLQEATEALVAVGAFLDALERPGS
jgi:monoterpene epsilon-lactone hydrolase